MRIGLTNGCFDTFHNGHRYFLKECRKRCEYLIVAVNTDESVKRLKGCTRPLWKLNMRMMAVNVYADATIPTDGRIHDLVRSIRPYVLFRGWDQDDNGAQWAQTFIAIPRLNQISTTGIIRQYERQDIAPNCS